MELDADASTTISLTRAEALVLFDWLHNLEDRDATPGDEAERRALWNLSAKLEGILAEPFDPNYEDLVQAAKERLTDQR